MVDEASPIQVPPRGGDEADATPQQLELIRQLLEGSSIVGFRVDYRRLSSAQASAVIEQLLVMQGPQGAPAPRARRSGGVVSAIRSLVTLVLVVAVMGGIAVGGYLLYERLQGQSSGGDDIASVNEDGQTTAAGDAGEYEESPLFDGLLVPKRDGGDGDEDRGGSRLFDLSGDGDGSTTPQVTPDTPTPPDTPRIDPMLARQLQSLDKMLLELKHITYSEYTPDIRSQSTSAMQTRLNKLPTAMSTIAEKDPALGELIRGVIDGYSEAAIDGPGMREQIDVIRTGLSSLRTTLEAE